MSPDQPEVPELHHGLLMALSYRFLGSISEAEDATQETYLRWFRLAPDERSEITNPRAWLSTTVSRICLDTLKSARARRERYVGEWLPEPVPPTLHWTTLANRTDAIDPADRIGMNESISLAILVLLESMTPAERVALILHDVFEYRFVEIGNVLGRSAEACRQLAANARRRVRQSRRTPIARDAHAAAVHAFHRAWESGDIAALVRTLDPAAQAVVDGGGAVSAALAPIHGARKVAEFFAGAHTRAPGLVTHEAIVGGEPGLVATAQGRTVAAMGFEIRSERITAVWALRNPDKLTRWGGRYSRSFRLKKRTFSGLLAAGAA
ncbi:putative sigma factor [Leucobacter sp. 7(1)]|uniref:RNA polymerase sigma factor SigJ n=1 Tax=Leucobacter sp. 7(1) TaxID=1255613 RepID=UPI00097F42A8|nr:RNA polymerase sigma factor SigJ [Leucobacter sp. 7(1)]SJN08541.1 putative sigma factor [Leucobacter sp. 7(1)]